MTIATESNRTAELTTDGVETDFDFGMLIHADTEVQVWYAATGDDYAQLVLDTDYTVVFTEDGGTVTTIGGSSPYAAGKILIIRHLALTQQTNWLFNDNHTGPQHEDDFDRAVMRDLQIQEQLDRCVGFAITSETENIEFPEPLSDNIIGWNTAATALENKDLVADIVALPAADGNFIVGDGTNFVVESGATARASLGLTIGTDVLAQQTIGIADDNLLEVDGTPNDNEYAKFTANGLEGRTAQELSDELEATIDHDNLLNYVANEHIDHTSVTLTAGTGLTGGGDISANRTFAVDGLLEDLDTLGANAADSEFIVGTGAGTLAWEKDDTARTSLGLGTGDSPTWAGATITNCCVLGSDSAVFQPNADSTTFFQVLDADGGTPVLNIDTTNGILTVPESGIFGTTGALPDADIRLYVKGAEFPVALFERDLTELAAADVLWAAVDYLVERPGNMGDGFGIAFQFNIKDEAGVSNRLGGIGAVRDGADNSGELQVFLRENDVQKTRLVIKSDGKIGLGDELLPETLTEWTHAQPYLTLHNSTHEDTDGGRESRLNFKGEQGVSPFEETTLARIEVSHDGSGADDKGKMVASVNTGAGLVEAMRLDSNLAAFFTKIKLTAIGGYAVKLTNKTGANSVAGQVVKADNDVATGTDDAVILTTADEFETIGIFLDSGVADGSEAWVVVFGIADVAMEDDTAATRGYWVRTSVTEAGYADATNAAPPGAGIVEIDRHLHEIGHCLESVAAGGGGTHILARCLIHFN